MLIFTSDLSYELLFLADCFTQDILFPCSVTNVLNDVAQFSSLIAHTCNKLA